MGEADVDGVQRILGVLQPVARPDLVALEQHHTLLFKLGFARQVEHRWFAFAEVGEDQAAILVHGIGRHTDARLGTGPLGGAFDALAARVVFPAVVHAAQFVPLDPAGVQLGQAVGAAIDQQVGAAALAAVQRQVFAQQPDFAGLAGGHASGQRDGVPELAQHLAHRGVGRGLGQLLHPHSALLQAVLIHGLRVRWVVGHGGGPYFSEMFDSSITLLHRAISFAINSRACAGVPLGTLTPDSASRFTTSGRSNTF